MKILIIGAGEVGQHLARTLSTEHHRIVVIDRNPEVLSRLEDALDVQVLVGSGAAAGLLERAGAWEADLVLAVTNNNEVNILAAYLAKVQGAGRTIVRFTDSEILGFHRHFYKKTFGIDQILVPLELCAQEINELIRARHAVAVENFAGGQIQMRQVQVLADSPWAGQKIVEARIPKQTLVAAVMRGRQIMIPSGDTEILPEDEILIIGQAAAMNELGKAAGRSASPVRRVVIVGGGDLGLAVARSLEHAADLEVRLIETDLHRAEQLSEELESITVLHGDGTDVSVLKEVGADRAEVFVTTSGDDEKNLIICQLAKKLGARKTIALVHKPSYISLYEELGVDAAISPRLLMAEKILRYVRGGEVASLAVIEEDRAEVIEIQAQPGSKITQTPLAKVGFPRGAIIGAVARGNKVYIPDGDFRIQPEDACIIFTFTENFPLIKKFFRGREKKAGENTGAKG